MSLINASMGRPAEESKKAATPHGCSFLPGLLAATLGMLALAGCTTAPPAPVRVEVPVMVSCIGVAPERPAYEFDKLPATATDGEIILALARDWARGRKYESEVEAVIAGCLSVASPPSVQVEDLPPWPTSTAPQAALQPSPLAGHFLTRCATYSSPRHEDGRGGSYSESMSIVCEELCQIYLVNLCNATHQLTRGIV